MTYSYLAPIRRACMALAILLTLTLAVLVPVPGASAASGELVHNSDFAAGTQGWQMKSPTEHRLSVTTSPVRTGTNAARIDVKAATYATLHDEVNTVASTVAGTKYKMTAWVKSSRSGITAEVKAREVGTADTYSHKTSARIDNTDWQQITLDFTAKWNKSQLDLNVNFWDTAVGQQIYVDSVSLVESGSAPVQQPPVQEPSAPQPPAEQPTAPQPPISGDKCEAAPPTGTVFGTNVSLVNQTLDSALKKMDSTFGKVKVVRQFDPGLPFSWSSRKAELLKGRTLVTSFKVAPTAITSGKHDAFFQNWFKTAPTDQTIYWSYFHEPENNISKGEFTVSQYRAAWTRLANIAKAACKPNMHSTLILTGWTMNPGSKRDYKVYDAGPEYIDVLAFDPYNFMYDTERTFYEPVDAMFGHIVTKMKADGRPWGIAETGSRLVGGDANGAKRAAWLRAMGTHLTQQKALFVTYFNSVGTNDYRLQDANSIAAWKTNVQMK